MEREILKKTTAFFAKPKIQGHKRRRKPEPELLYHFGLGSQYSSQEYRTHLVIMKMQQSTYAPEDMSGKGCCYDNLPTRDGFFAA